MAIVFHKTRAPLIEHSRRHCPMHFVVGNHSIQFDTKSQRARESSSWLPSSISLGEHSCRQQSKTVTEWTFAPLQVHVWTMATSSRSHVHHEGPQTKFVQESNKVWIFTFWQAVAYFSEFVAHFLAKNGSTRLTRFLFREHAVQMQIRLSDKHWDGLNEH